MLERIVCLAIGYVLGLFQTSYIYGRKQGIDIREHGSGNAGTTNAFRTMGEKGGSPDAFGRYPEMCTGHAHRKADLRRKFWRRYTSFGTLCRSPDVSSDIISLFI